MSDWPSDARDDAECGWTAEANAETSHEVADPFLFRVKPTTTGSKCIDVVGTYEALQKIRSMAPAFVVAVEEHALVNGQQTDSGLLVLRLEVIEVEMFQVPGSPNHEDQSAVPVDPVLEKFREAGFVDPALDQLRREGSI